MSSPNEESAKGVEDLDSVDQHVPATSGTTPSRVGDTDASNPGMQMPATDGVEGTDAKSRVGQFQDVSKENAKASYLQYLDDQQARADPSQEVSKEHVKASYLQYLDDQQARADPPHKEDAKASYLQYLDDQQARGDPPQGVSKEHEKASYLQYLDDQQARAVPSRDLEEPAVGVSSGPSKSEKPSYVRYLESNSNISSGSTASRVGKASYLRYVEDASNRPQQQQQQNTNPGSNLRQQRGIESNQNSRPGAYAGGAGGNLERRGRDIDGAQQHFMNSENLSNDQLETDVLPPPELAVARTVGEYSAPLTLAEEVDQEELQRRQTNNKIRRCWRMVGFSILAMFVILLAVTMGVFLSKEEPRVSFAPTAPPSKLPSAEPSLSPSSDLEGLVAMEFPSHTLEALHNPLSPQSLAKNWLSQHPNITFMADWEKQQLFGLVAFFYAMEGNKWPAIVSDTWLNYDRNPCDWFSSANGFWFLSNGKLSWSPGGSSEACDNNGKYEILRLEGLDFSLLDSPFIPPEVGFLTSLNTLGVGSNDINAKLSVLLPALTFEALSNITSLLLGSNNLTGHIPSEIGHMTNLQILELGSSNVTGPLPSELLQMTDLRALDLAFASIYEFPEGVDQLKGLQQISLEGCQISGTIPSDFFQNVSFSSLHLGSNSLTGTIPSEIASVAGLDSLSLRHNMLSGSIPKELSQLTNLGLVELNDNLLTGSIPTELATKVSTLNSLSLDNNALTGSIPTEIGNNKDLFFLNLGKNTFTGPIPSELGLLENVVVLNLSFNALSGSMPTELGQLRGLYYLLNIRSNSISGLIPTEVGLLSVTGGLLDFSDNQLTGPLPSELGMLSYLAILSLGTNLLNGPIPSEIGGMWSLVDLDLSKLLLRGTIPSDVAALATSNQLRWFNISQNMNLTGTLPEDICALQAEECECIHEAFCGTSCRLDFDCSEHLCGCSCGCSSI